MKKTKRYLSVLLTVIMLQSIICSVITVSASQTDTVITQAQTQKLESEATYGEYSYKASNDGVTITDYTGSGEIVVIPFEIDGLPVTAIGNYAFCCKDFKEIFIPDSITCIGTGAFLDCTSLREIGYTANEEKWSAIEIAEENDCLTSAEKIDCNRVACTHFRYKYNSKWEPEAATIFRYAGKESKYTIPSSIHDVTITDIEKNAFRYNTKLEEIVFPESITNVEENAFDCCTNLREVYYEGTLEEWQAITIAYGNDYLRWATIHYAIPDISLDKETLILGVGQTYILSATVSSATEVIWTSSNWGVATVTSQGKISAKGEGTTVITAKTKSGKSASCTVVVGKAPESIELNKTEYTMGIGQTYILKSTISPADAYTYCNWKSSDVTVATVTSTGKITAKGLGTATITVKTSNGKTATCNVTVKKAPESIALNKKSVTLGVKQTCNLVATLTPVDCATYCTWKSSNTAVVTVNSSGKLVAKKVGTATISVKTSNGKVATCAVTVKKAPDSIALNKSEIVIAKGNKETLTATLSPSNSATFCSWSSSDQTVASVSSIGVVTAKKAGTAVITVKTSNGKTAACTVKVGVLPTKVTLDYQKIFMDFEDVYILKPTAYPSNAVTSYRWSSSDEEVVKVDETGRIIPIGLGTAKIVVITDNQKAAYCTVTVQMHIPKDNPNSDPELPTFPPD